MHGRLIPILAARFWAALLVLTIAFHAGVPVSTPLDVRSGSAFSADTVDVAVTPPSRLAAQAAVAQPQPMVAVLVAYAVPRLAPAPYRWPDATGPPVARIPLARNLAPRAPPIA